MYKLAAGVHSSRLLGAALSFQFNSEARLLALSTTVAQEGLLRSVGQSGVRGGDSSSRFMKWSLSSEWWYITEDWPRQAGWLRIEARFVQPLSKLQTDWLYVKLDFTLLIQVSTGSLILFKLFLLHIHIYIYIYLYMNVSILKYKKPVKTNFVF